MIKRGLLLLDTLKVNSIKPTLQVSAVELGL